MVAWNFQQKRIDELVGTLEKAQRANAAQDDHINQQQDRIDVLEKRNAELGKRVCELESRPVTPVMYSENSVADHCRQQAWEHVKGEVSTDGWSTGDSVNYFGFFCWGWDMRRQFNEQRPVTVTLPEGTGWSSDPYNHGRNDGISECTKAIRAAGIGVKGE
ncbi:hypothetical protein GV761_07030 [Citrobacter werkmanii]|uniref:hypothetical protein n=1 Tax=Citrobacter werkmanii TaxID=67827 RepID=UPI001376E4F2|nr:hypothetical protein [Citrobacter werkmanii]NBD81020.1 hypothetical protein [Citrobacter werkmanii]